MEAMSGGSVARWEGGGGTGEEVDVSCTRQEQGKCRAREGVDVPCARGERGKCRTGEEVNMPRAKEKEQGKCRGVEEGGECRAGEEVDVPRAGEEWGECRGRLSSTAARYECLEAEDEPPYCCTFDSNFSPILFQFILRSQDKWGD